MTIKPPETLEEYKECLNSVLELMSNPYCDHQMFLDLKKKRLGLEKEIEKLKG